MTRAMAALFILAAFCAGHAQAQGLQRNYGVGGYGVGGYGVGGFGSTNPYNNNNANSRATTTTNTPTDQGAASTSSDYDRVMNSVNNSTSGTLGKSDTEDGTTDPNADPNVDANGNVTQPSTTLPTANNAFNTNRGAAVTGALPATNNGFTTPSGTIGLGTYNRSPYASGLGSATTTNNAAPGPVTPTYTGQ